MSANTLACINSNICATCLSRGRQLFLVNEINQLPLFYCDIKLSEKQDKVCWECIAMMRKIILFRNRALKAQLMLTEVIQKKKCDILLRSLSCLTTECVTTATYSIPEVHMKSDSGFVTIKHEIQYVNEVIKPDHMYIVKDDEKSILESNSKAVLSDDDNVNDGNCTYDEETELSNKANVDDVDMIDAEIKIKQDIGENRSKNAKKTAKRNIKRGINVIDKNGIVNKYTIKILNEDEMTRAREDRRRREVFINSLHRCDRCIETYPDREELEKHNKKHDENVGKLSCAVCEQRFISENALDAHIQTHYRCYVCCICKLEYKDIDAVFKHHDTVHKVKLRQCNKCDKQFMNESKYKVHWRRAHAQHPTCDVCDKRCSNMQNLKRHLLLHTGMPMVKCEVCHKEYRGQWGLQAHMRTHDQKRDEAAFCAECGVQFKNVYLYRSHLRNSLKHVAAEDLKFKCPECDKRFQSRSYLRCHIDSMHSDTLKYLCHMCSQAFRTTIRLRVHVREKHEGKAKPKNKICNICAKAFNSKATLQQHINSHVGARPYACATCGATFSYSGALYTHNKLLHRKRDGEGS